MASNPNSPQPRRAAKVDRVADMEPATLRARLPRREESVEIAPIIFLVSSEASVLEALETDLGRRFGNDTRIIAASGKHDHMLLGGPANDYPSDWARRP